jgi:Topoisomerase IA
LVFNEITKEAIEQAYQHTREIDDNLVQAQETRRVVDRLYGYEVSPILWRKINRGLSAGRVQSPAMRMIVERERERMAHVAANYSSVTAIVTHPETDFEAKLYSVDGLKLATGKSFDANGQLNGEFMVLDPQQAKKLEGELAGKSVQVLSVESKPTTRKPYAPFTTSTLQQDASRKLGLSAKQTMDLAQQLYQEGHITYMRTDSANLSAQAISAARKEVESRFGIEYLPEKPKQYGSSNKNAQEAHEAIRPSGDSFLYPADLPKSLSPKAIALYELI